jgi:hypothetical protein
MPERFTYPSGAREEMLQQRRRRLWLWLLILGLFWAIGWHFALSSQEWLGLLIALGASAMVVFAESLLRRFERRGCDLVQQALEYDGRRLRQVTLDGAVLGEIDLSAPFSVSYPYSAAGNAIFLVTQGRRCLEFSSRICGAERLVREVLRHDEWPPGANST